MRVVLQIEVGPRAGQTFELRPGQIAQVGRSSWADLSLPEDSELADLHFLLECGASACKLRDLNSRGGVLRNEARVVDATLTDGDRIRAGRTVFTVRFAAAAPAPPAIDVSPPASSLPPTERLLQLLRGQDEPLFALLDAARDIAVLAHLNASQEPHQSLYEGAQGEELALFAPYLVSLPTSSPLLEALVHHGWGQSWGIYLTSRSPFAEVRKHFRRFLMVRTEAGKRLYFRFYDPRVLRVYLPACTADEARDFFGPVGCFLLEGQRPETLLRFVGDGPGVRQEMMSLEAATPGSSVGEPVP
jgi:hypothetical protein